MIMQYVCNIQEIQIKNDRQVGDELLRERGSERVKGVQSAERQRRTAAV